ncbi:hypothetical protein ABIB14_003430, partial [Arthrobacter sp. UYEF3]
RLFNKGVGRYLSASAAATRTTLHTKPTPDKSTPTPLPHPQKTPQTHRNQPPQRCRNGVEAGVGLLWSGSHPHRPETLRRQPAVEAPPPPACSRLPVTQPPTQLTSSRAVLSLENGPCCELLGSGDVPGDKRGPSRDAREGPTRLRGNVNGYRNHNAGGKAPVRRRARFARQGDRQPGAGGLDGAATDRLRRPTWGAYAALSLVVVLTAQTSHK